MHIAQTPGLMMMMMTHFNVTKDLLKKKKKRNTVQDLDTSAKPINS